MEFKCAGFMGGKATGWCRHLKERDMSGWLGFNSSHGGVRCWATALAGGGGAKLGGGGGWRLKRMVNGPSWGAMLGRIASWAEKMGGLVL
jgi:hypothetical protein